MYKLRAQTWGMLRAGHLARANVANGVAARASGGFAQSARATYICTRCLRAQTSIVFAAQDAGRLRGGRHVRGWKTVRRWRGVPRLSLGPLARSNSAIVNWSQYLAVRGVAGFIQCFDVDQNLETAGLAGSIFGRLNPRRCARAADNIRASFPDWPEERIRSVAFESIRHMFQLFMVESMISPRLISPSSWSKYVRVGDVSGLLDLLMRSEPAIFVTGHCGNWELLGCVLASIGYPLVALARPLDNPLLDDWMLRIREARGMTVVTKWGATPILQDTLRSGGRLGFIADQNAGDGGLFVPFFGRYASAYKSIGLLAMRYNVPIVAGGAKRVGERFQYQLHFADMIRPEDWANQPDPLFYITARYTRAIEAVVRGAPEQYLWIHRRWKSRPKFIREGHDIPARLVRKLEQLPWMTPAELDWIVRSSNDEAAAVRSRGRPAPAPDSEPDPDPEAQQALVQ
jgi:Kdo2-lipid IVA lauroyltransferase/acyltransferase